MSKRSKKSSKKVIPSSAMLVDRKAFLSAIGITSYILQVMGDEMEQLRQAKEMNPEVRKALIKIVAANLQNVAQVSLALNHSVYDPIDPEGIRLPHVN